MANININGIPRPRHSVTERSKNQLNGLFIPNTAIYVSSGSINNVISSTTGSTSIQFDTYAYRIHRVEVFHSGTATTFDVSIESSAPNTGSFFDPRDVIVEYKNLDGSDNYSTGMDQVENLIALTDVSGNLHLKMKPYGLLGNNNFKYLLVLEPLIVYYKSDGSI